MNNREKKFFDTAREVSYLSDYKGTHVGAVVVYKKYIISTGFNSQKTSPRQYRYNLYRGFRNVKGCHHTQHAELAALNHLIGKDIDWANVSIFVYRELKDGTPACSKPCPACDKLIKNLGIKTVYYIDREGNFVKERIL